MKDVSSYDVLVVGAGISGLAAAYNLKKKQADLRILIVEAKGRVGGRTETVELTCDEEGRKAKWDVGGQWVTDTQTHITALLAELAIDTYAQDIGGRKLLEINKRLCTYNSSIPNVSLMSLVDLQRMSSKVKRNASRVSTLNPFADIELAKQLDAVNLESFCKPMNATARNLLDAGLQVVYGLGFSQVNALFGLMYA